MDEATYIAVCEAHMTSLFRVACSIVGSRQDAEDAVQQALLNAWRHRAKARPGSERAWLMRILVNECRSILRRRGRSISLEDIPYVASPVTADVDLQTAIRALPESLRTPLLLKYMEGMSEKEVAAAMHLPVSSVKSRLFRARNTLKKQLSEEVSP